MKLSNMTGSEMLQAIDAMKKTLNDVKLLEDIDFQIAADHNIRRKCEMLDAVKQLYRWTQGGEMPKLNAADVFNPHSGPDKTNIYYLFKELRKGMPWEIRRDYLVLPFALTLTLFDSLNTLFPCPEVTRGIILNQKFINVLTLPKYRPEISDSESAAKRERYLRQLDQFEKDFESLYTNLSVYFARIIDPEKDKVVKDIHETKIAAKKVAAKILENDKPASFVAQANALSIWNEYRNNVEVKTKYCVRGHRVTYADVFDYCKKRVQSLGLKTAAEFEKAVKAAKKRENK